MENSRNNKRIAFAFILATLIISSCKKLELNKIATEAWSPNLAVPLAIGEFGVYDVLSGNDSSVLSVGQDVSLAILYSENKDILVAADLIDLPNQNFNYSASMASYGVPIVPSFSGTQTVSTNQTFSLNNAAGGSLYTIDFQSGILNIDVATNLMHSLKYDFIFPDLLENGIPVTRTIDLVYNGSTPQVGTTTVNLNNAILDLTNGSGGSNEIRVNLDLTITGSGNPIFGTEYANFDLNLSNLDFDLITGEFSSLVLPNAMDTIALKLFNNTTQGTFTIVNPTMEFKFGNSFGLPVDINFNSIKTKELVSGAEFPLTGFPASFSLAQATNVGQVATSTLMISDQNSANIQDILSPTPKILIYDIGGSIPTAGTQFIAHDSKINLQGTLTLPLEGYATGFVMRDTIAATVNLDNEFIESAMIRLNIDNGFPIEAKVHILLVDANYNVLKDLTNGYQDLIKAAPVDGTGKVTQSAKAINDFTLTNAELPTVKNTAYIIFEVGGQTTDGNLGTVVKFYDSYKLSLRLGLQVQGKVKI
ncbi:MAG: hypothetical protein WC044_02730 [Crocinitomicaceae bacterium]